MLYTLQRESHKVYFCTVTCYKWFSWVGIWYMSNGHWYTTY